MQADPARPVWSLTRLALAAVAFGLLGIGLLTGFILATGWAVTQVDTWRYALIACHHP